MACFRLFTRPPFPPLPDFSVPRFRRRIALLTDLPAAFPYRAMEFSSVSISLSRVQLREYGHALSEEHRLIAAVNLRISIVGLASVASSYDLHRQADDAEIAVKLRRNFRSSLLG
jgi:hypothetical protein